MGPCPDLTHIFNRRLVIRRHKMSLPKAAKDPTESQEGPQGQDESSQTDDKSRREARRNRRRARREKRRRLRNQNRYIAPVLNDPARPRGHYEDADEALIRLAIRKFGDGTDEDELDAGDRHLCSSQFQQDCLYISTMFMNFFIILLSVILMVNFNVVECQVNQSLAAAVFWLALATILSALVSWACDYINCCKLDIHYYIDTCPLVTWMICNTLFLIINFVQIIVILVFLVVGQANCTEEPNRKNIFRRLGFSLESVFSIGVSFIVITFIFALLRIWFLCIVNELRKVIEKEYPSYGFNWCKDKSGSNSNLVEEDDLEANNTTYTPNPRLTAESEFYSMTILERTTDDSDRKC